MNKTPHAAEVRPAATLSKSGRVLTRHRAYCSCGWIQPHGNGGKVRAQIEADAHLAAVDPWTPEYAPWRHGGWYVLNVRYRSGAVGCVSRNYADHQWRVVAEGGRVEAFGDFRSFPSRAAAARAERLRAWESALVTTDRGGRADPAGER